MPKSLTSAWKVRLCLSVPTPDCPKISPAGKFEYRFPSTEQEPVETPFASKSTMTSTIFVVAMFLSLEQSLLAHLFATLTRWTILLVMSQAHLVQKVLSERVSRVIIPRLEQIRVQAGLSHQVEHASVVLLSLLGNLRNCVAVGWASTLRAHRLVVW